MSQTPDAPGHTPGPVEVAQAEKLFDAILGNVAAYGEWGTPSYREAALREISAAFARHRIEAARPVSGEPVAWMYECGQSRIIKDCRHPHFDGYTETPLYAARPVQSELVEALEKIASGEAFREMRFAEDDATEYHLRRERKVMRFAQAALKATGDGL